MRRKLITLTFILAILTALPFNIGFGQNTVDTTRTYVGLSWEGNAGVVVGGEIIDISDKLKTFGYARLSIVNNEYTEGMQTQHAVAAKMLFRLINQPDWTIDLIAGGSADWANSGELKGSTLYITQAAGVLVQTPAGILKKLPFIGQFINNPKGWLDLEYRPQWTDPDSSWPKEVVIGFGISGEFFSTRN